MLSQLKVLHSVALVLFLVSSAVVGAGQVSPKFHRTFAVSLAESVGLRLDLLEADLRVGYARDGEIAVSVATQDATSLDLESLSSRVVTAQTGNNLEIWERPGAGSPNLKLVYTIDVPYRTEVHASVQRGRQTITGIMGPVSAETGIGDIDVSYIAQDVTATTRMGNLNFEVVGGRIKARSGQGAIACQRVPQGIGAETDDGDISLAVVGDSTAIVQSGNGRIDVGGARGTLLASTAGGDVHVKALPHQDWQLSSKSGTVRIDFPPATGFYLDAVTSSGELKVRRDGLDKTNSGLRHITQDVNAGGERVGVRTDTGNIIIE